ncbi:class I SAM-dependent RNA methyltransferase [Lentzea tibetensis]|uniref:Class I SAM-dependent RNA methyltransferase n=1 Tax=Lentzea tibetensis TaxID=2591470 RepID=A0A563EP48_9PSEU|nr:TRAM domain-containing protein [Lentzea tibetensis]TWP48985.1 class I SAM-dependent RNA methyltransferase [Lentzea tibetensis]
MSDVDWTGQRLEVEVGPVAHGGHCVARHEGRVLFVRHALPGERVIALVDEDKGGSFCRADAVEVLEASPDRVEPPCPFSGPGQCGGCDWQHAAPAAQRDLKAQVVAEQLLRLAKLDWTVTVEELPGGPLGWRTRVRMAVDRDGRPGFRVHRGHRVLPVDSCAIAAPGVVDAALGEQWPPGSEIGLTRDAEGTVHVSEIHTDRRTRRTRSIRRQGTGRAVELAANRKWRVDADGFWQVHPAAADTFAQVVGEWAACAPGSRAWDLYGGAGLFASVLARQVGENGNVLVVESAGGAVRDGMAALARLPQVRWVTDRVDRFVAGGQSGEDPDVVVLDPPRKGAGQAVVAEVARRRPDRVIYVACDPAALARDVAEFARQGYRLEDLRAFDAFPMTHHVECVALLVPETE